MPGQKGSSAASVNKGKGAGKRDEPWGFISAMGQK